MNKAIEQTIQFKSTTAAELFDILLTSEKHSEIHGGSKTNISKKEGATFSLLNGDLNGKNLMIVPNRMIVQAWRGNVWKKDDPDSILILMFMDTKNGAKIEMVHAFTPDQFVELWDKVYWQPIKQYLINQKES
jgi:activator of HSP90 ATPase